MEKKHQQDNAELTNIKNTLSVFAASDNSTFNKSVTVSFTEGDEIFSMKNGKKIKVGVVEKKVNIEHQSFKL